MSWAKDAEEVRLTRGELGRLLHSLIAKYVADAASSWVRQLAMLGHVPASVMVVASRSARVVVMRAMESTHGPGSIRQRVQDMVDKIIAGGVDWEREVFVSLMGSLSDIESLDLVFSEGNLGVHLVEPAPLPVLATGVLSGEQPPGVACRWLREGVMDETLPFLK